ncbi:hypothetical protein Ddc_16036 [Ditylenchus destructor]|nr:hypothetical protein Ddc_16036 [Ditylenchus destructor]
MTSRQSPPSVLKGHLGIAFVPIGAIYVLFLVLTTLAIVVDLTQGSKRATPTNGEDQYFEDLFNTSAFPVKFNRPSRVVPLIFLSGIATVLVVIYATYVAFVCYWRKR